MTARQRSKERQLVRARSERTQGGSRGAITVENRRNKRPAFFTHSASFHGHYYGFDVFVYRSVSVGSKPSCKESLLKEETVLGVVVLENPLRCMPLALSRVEFWGV
jgi:hypothetical protein